MGLASMLRGQRGVRKETRDVNVHPLYLHPNLGLLGLLGRLSRATDSRAEFTVCVCSCIPFLHDPPCLHV